MAQLWGSFATISDQQQSTQRNWATLGKTRLNLSISCSISSPTCSISCLLAGL